MDLKSIQEKINKEFEAPERRLVFWYDDNDDYFEEINQIELNRFVRELIQ